MYLYHISIYCNILINMYYLFSQILSYSSVSFHLYHLYCWVRVNSDNGYGNQCIHSHLFFLIRPFFCFFSFSYVIVSLFFVFIPLLINVEPSHMIWFGGYYLWALVWLSFIHQVLKYCFFFFPHVAQHIYLSHNCQKLLS